MQIGYFIDPDMHDEHVNTLNDNLLLIGSRVSSKWDLADGIKQRW